MYLTFKALHLISMVAWFAGLFYIFRLYVYHVKHRDSAEICAAYEVMEYKLIYMIMHPAMLVTLIFGLCMLIMNRTLFEHAWLHLKLFLVALLIGYQFFAAYVQRRFAKKDFFLTEKTCRIINEFPTLILIAVIFLAILKP